MAGQGYPNEGADRRLIGGLGWLQRDLIVREGHCRAWYGRRKWRGWIVTVQPWPPFLMLESPITFAGGVIRWRQVRIGWTFRKVEGYYIPGAAFKTESGEEPDYS